MIAAFTSLATFLAGIGWEPHIRGVLTVAVAMAILAGSVWLMLVTNTGTRLGSLIAIAGFFGWMFVMGIFWWIYGIGWVGSAPSWEIDDVYSDPAGVEVAGIGDAYGTVGDLPDANCSSNAIKRFPPADVGDVSIVAVAGCTPPAIDVFMSYPGVERELILQELLNPQLPESKLNAILQRNYDVAAFTEVDAFDVVTLDIEAALESLTRNERNEVFHELVQARSKEITDLVADNNERSPQPVSDEQLAALQTKRLSEAQIRIDQMSLSFLRGAAPDIAEWALDEGHIDLRGWELQTASQAGEATATADAFLRDGLFPDGNFVVLDAYQQGGKAKRDGDNMLDRVLYKFTSAAQVTHPTNYTVINVQQTADKPSDPSQPPPVPEANPEADTYSVVLIRNLGNLRLIPGLFTMGSLVLFLLTCYILHVRDLALREKGLEV